MRSSNVCVGARHVNGPAMHDCQWTSSSFDQLYMAFQLQKYLFEYPIYL